MKKFKLLALLLFAIVLIVYWGLLQYLTLENLKLNRDLLETFYVENRMVMIGGFVAVYILIGLLLLPGATFLSFAAGFIFGPGLGLLIVSIGSTLGATLAFLVSRYLLRGWVTKKFSKSLQGIDENISGNPLSCILFFRLIPLFPFFAVNIAMALSHMPLKYFFFGTLLGKLPATYIYASAGSNLATIHTLSEIMSVKVLGSLSLLGLLALIPVVYKRMKA
jgi:uncharacterized membrane protein YdjX (TVP38/TMEM64 family)